ncbi:MAG: RNA-binding S4 domain-containing protein [Bacteroidaceae bacterium]|nr:RNA-binding S4 domain-containing protein [Bacteroidaceae bacterium]
MATARIDKWLWAVRIFKTRSIAAEACKKGRVTLNGSQAKPAHTVKEGDVVGVKKPPITWSFKVKQAIEKRIGAKLVNEMMENVTTPDQLELLEVSKINGFVNRAKGTGRPTKKERRELDEFTDPVFMADFDFDFDDEEDI